ncbi:OTU family cysteine protease [Besnoitia besnoiti]|uniref:OTU family cysteine protease n=1 Tax=Besnoitia besnoiti TaxID=94643 RepID=A0A2A9MD87_BESBE|nr:OTU family cysteine protease [Besnoitia besnoiti]PFH33577.1 OTU family cysteine protease [Besnoitia besnoiti]
MEQAKPFYTYPAARQARGTRKLFSSRLSGWGARFGKPFLERAAQLLSRRLGAVKCRCDLLGAVPKAMPAGTTSGAFFRVGPRDPGEQQLALYTQECDDAHRVASSHMDWLPARTAGTYLEPLPEELTTVFEEEYRDIPEELADSEGPPTRVSSPRGSTDELCATGTRLAPFSRATVALHSRVFDGFQPVTPTLADTTSAGRQASQETVKRPLYNSKPPEAALPPSKLPFIAPDEQYRRQLASVLGTPAQKLSMSSQPHLSFYHAAVVGKRDVCPDGNCQFRSASYALLGTEAAHGEIRRQVSAYLRRHLDRFNWLICPDRLEEDERRMAPLDKRYGTRVPHRRSRRQPTLTTDQLKENWITRLGDSRYGIWGDESTLVGLAEVYRLRIVVEQQDRNCRRATQMGSHAVQVFKPDDSPPDDDIPTIFLGYEVRRQHYNVIDRVCKQ